VGVLVFFHLASVATRMCCPQYAVAGLPRKVLGVFGCKPRFRILRLYENVQAGREGEMTIDKLAV
jgi:hypothetical protein